MARRARWTISRKTAAWLLSSCLVTTQLAACGGDTAPSGSRGSSASGDTTSSGTTGGGGAGGMSSGTGGTAGSGGMGGVGGMASATGTGGTTSSGGGMGGAATVCTPNEEVVCYSGPLGTAGVGLCTTGKKTCDALGASFGPCVGEVLPEPETCLDADDNDCNGETNEDGAGCACAPNSTASCYDGPAGTLGIGVCKGGTHTCDPLGTGYGPCVGEITPLAETCATAFDDDCNGQTNEGGAGCGCVPNSTASCYTGPVGTMGVGLCVAGTQTCNPLGTGYGACVGETTPQAETCANAVDDDCNGQTNEGGAGCACAPNSTSSCYSGPAGTVGVGICAAGTKTCNGLGTAYGACVGEVLPQAETCATPVDDNCNGLTNEGGVGCACAPNSTSSCYSGPAGTAGVGICAAGTKTCNAQGTAYGACVGEVLPQAETCATPVDDNCNGVTNEGGVGCACAPNAATSCYSGPAGTAGVGICTTGMKTCNAQGTAYGACVGEITPQAETCTTSVDDNCNGLINEGGAGCVCAPSSSTGCYSGPAGTLGVGICIGGTKTCNAQGTGYGACVGEVTPQAETCSNAVDDDCNGQTNEGGVGCVCAPNATASCYSGPAGTAGIGVCAAGTKTCNALGTAYGACAGEVVPQAESCGTAADDNCDGQSNEGCACVPSSTASCYSGPTGTLGVGICAAGTKTCNAQGTTFGPCVGDVVPQTESCATGGDENCNGQVNEGCICAPNSSASCYSGPAGTAGVGVCHGGTQTCNAQGTAYGACVGEVTPQAETCSTPGDDDCNGQTNEGGVGCACAPNATASCYSGPAGTAGVGICAAGTKTCNAQGTAYGACVGEVLPQAETCTTSVDDNCNGLTNEGGVGCVCAPNAATSCYSGPAGTAGVGICTTGVKTCNAQGTAYGACVGEITPQAETCTTSVDDDCNGQTNEGGAGCACAPNTSASCYSGPAGTQGVGLCAAGTKTCNAQGTAYAACVGEITPQAETCATPGDDNCNGLINEGGAGCVCAPSSTTGCYSGPAGTLGVGICIGGTKTCNAQGTGYGACVGEVTPQAETCGNSTDDDCNGQTNEGGVGCACAPNATASCYSGPAGTVGVGVCAAGTKTCNALGTAYGACAGEVVPQTETCTNSVDDNCNGVVNESGTGCVCAPNSTASCYSGPAGTAGVGICASGTKTCNALGTAYGACAGEVLPQTETCTTSVDDNCNGQTNESGTGCVCTPNSTASCYSGPTGTVGVGICVAGSKVCNGQGTAYGACAGEVLPQTETCTTAVDDNCNGVTNESGTGCVCTPNATTSCYSGPAGTSGVGICKAGTQLCNGQGTAIGACSGAVLPQSENCATAADEDCDGLTPACSGTHLWSKAWGGTVDDEGNSLAVDAADNILYGGYANGPVDFGCGPQPVAAGVDAALLMKLTPAGACTWAKSFGNNSQVTGVAVDASGNVFATGIFGVSINLGNGVTVTSAGGNDGFVAKYDPAGNYLWSRTFGDVAAQTTDSVATDASGNVFAYGYFNGTIDLGGGALVSAGGSDLYVAKYSPTGVHLWSKRFGDGVNQISKGLAVDVSGNVLFTGTLNGSVSFGGVNLNSAGNGDVFVVKLGPTGAFVWNKVFGDSSAQVGSGVATDAAGNVFLSGYFLGTMNFGGASLPTAGGADCYLAKLDPTGAHLWSLRAGGLSNQSFVAVAVDPFGNVATVGVLTGSGSFGGPVLTSAGSNDIVVAKYSASGAYLWSKSFGDAASQGVKGLAEDSLGDTLFTGLLFGPTDFGGGAIIGAGGEDTFVTKLGP